MFAQHILTDQIDVANAPAIPGLVFRRFRGESDYPKMAALIQRASDGDQMDRAVTPEEVAQNYEHLYNSSAQTDMLFAEVDGEVIAYSRVWWWQVEATKERVYGGIAYLLPEWRRKRIGRAMLAWNQQRCREIAAEHPEDGERFFFGFAADCETGAVHLLKNDGYEVTTQHATMVRPDLENIPDAPFPDGIEVRPVEPEHLRPIWEAEIEAFRDHWGFAEPDADGFQSFLDEPFMDDRSLWRVAWAGDQVAGMVRSFINPVENEQFKRLRGWTEHISVRRPWRRQGLARALLCLSLQAVKERGMTEAALGVHLENPNHASRLYESVGFRVSRIHFEYRKPMT